MTYMVPANEIKRLLMEEPLIREDDYACLFQELLGERLAECKTAPVRPR